MKVAVINFSGNVGKTTVARHLLMPRMEGARYVAVESINADEGQVDALRGKQFAQLQEFLLVSDDAIVDIGASNVEETVALMRRYKDSHEDFDYYVVPAVPATKQQRDTMATLMTLVELGVDPKRIRVVFNQVEAGAHPIVVFEPIFRYAESAGLTEISQNAKIGENELFDRLKGSSSSIDELARDATDYKALIAKESDPTKKSALAGRLATKRLAMGVMPMLDMCFDALRLR